ncbi:FAD:protein FMN transferase [Mycobacterium sp.]|uniref:FAD:protein FMN transferase n=1 Tax=Mycobacterium sp. TaxID=1785 RepID=UPI002CA5271C|nr:FAD:protein FMN transferase [Mycobacterium sp.]HKP44632.1 FAD:protein FMN transferase [Mycobacterium sp.]
MTSPSELVGITGSQSQWKRWSTGMHLLVTEPEALAAAREVVDTELDAIELAASRFRSDSELSMLAAGERTPVSPVLADLIDAALTAARFTDGDVDPTVGGALIALGYDRDIDQLETSARVTSVVIASNWSMVEFDGHTVRLPAGVLLDLGATAKAVAADRCVQRVYDETGSGVLINLGGDIATAGPSPDGGWQVRVQDTDDDPSSSVALGSGAGLATSSTCRRRWWHGGDLVHHILDPRTGRSVEPVWRSVSVAAQTCLAANAMSTAAIVRGKRATDWIAGLAVPARLVDRDGAVHTLGGWPSA